MRAGKDADAIREFKAAIPILLAASRENADDDDATRRRRRAASGCRASWKPISSCWRTRSPPAATSPPTPSALRIRSAAVRCSRRWRRPSARASIKDPALAELVRKEQDLGKQVNAQLGLLNNCSLCPPLSATKRASRPINASIEKLRSDRDKARAEINKRFPSYADLVDPKPPSVDADQGDAGRRRGDAVVLFRTRCELCLGRAERRAGGVCGDQGDSRRHREQGAQAARGARAAGGDDFRHPAVRSHARL